MKKFGYVIFVLFGIVALISVAFLLELGGLEWNKFFKPKREAIRRDVFKETKSYNESKLQDLARYRLQYIEADNEESKSAIKSTINLMFADYDRSRLPAELSTFLYQIRGY